MARLPANPKYGWFAKLLFWLGRRQLGRMLTPWRVSGLHPGIFFGTTVMILTQQAAKTVDPVVKSLARVQTARLIGCPF